jgi:hypothetical protein
MEPGDYMVIIEDDNGAELGRVLQSSDSKLPEIGHGVVIEPDEVPDRPHLARAYRIRDINQQPSPSDQLKRGKTRRRFKIPFVYVRADRGVPLQPPSATTPTGVPLGSLDGDLSRSVADEIARSGRQLATDLDDITDEVALAINEGTPLDRSLIERLNEARCLAKQNSLRALVHVHAKKGSPSSGR